MKAILKIGYTTFLFRDVETASKAMNLLSGAVEVDDRSYQGRVVLRDTASDIEVKVLPASMVLVRKRADGEEEPVVDITPRKKLRSAPRLQLPGV